VEATEAASKSSGGLEAWQGGAIAAAAAAALGLGLACKDKNTPRKWITPPDTGGAAALSLL